MSFALKLDSDESILFTFVSFVDARVSKAVAFAKAIVGFVMVVYPAKNGNPAVGLLAFATYPQGSTGDGSYSARLPGRPGSGSRTNHCTSATFPLGDDHYLLLSLILINFKIICSIQITKTRDKFIHIIQLHLALDSYQDHLKSNRM